jgi:DNA-binding beta-propeller fold protein YncE
VYVADWNRVQVFSPTGTYLSQWAVPCSAIATDSSGNVYVLDPGNGRIVKYTSAGGYITEWGSYGSGDGQFLVPEAVAVDASGTVYVSDDVTNRIQAFTEDGTYLTQWGTTGSGNGQFNRPIGIAVDAAGNIYVADGGNDRVQKFGPLPTAAPELESATWGQIKAKHR